jgi:hypothetical protein
VGSDTQYGAGLTFLQNKTGWVKVLFWAQDAVQLKQNWLELDWNPATTEALYTFSLTRRRESGADLWEVEVAVNRDSKVSLID